MSTFTFQFETKDFYLVNGQETSRELEIEFDASIVRGDLECTIEYTWDIELKKYISDCPYQLTARDKRAIEDKMYSLAKEPDNATRIYEDKKDSSIWQSIFGDD